jgi:N4-gp56 family major capsid protein|tara:strand:+ start:547 stop:1476 length:930 start_codon:yes stop_codon:yes gene_type:complete
MAYTQKSSVSSDQVAFEQLAHFALRKQVLHEDYATVKATKQTHNGSGVTFTIYNNLAQATSALTETSDVTAVALGDSTVTVSLAEYGNAVVTTAALRGQSFFNVDSDAANIVGFNAADSMDQVVADLLYAGSNVTHVSQSSRGALVAGNVITSDIVREEVAGLRSAAVPTFDGNAYIGFIHPDVAYDFIKGTAVTDLRSFQIRQDADGVRKGSIGMFDGVDFIETPRALLVADGGNSTVDAYGTVIIGQQAMAKGFSTMFGPDPSVVFGPVTDSLRRFQPVGWYTMCGYGRFREAAIRRIESASSIGAN